MRNYFYLNRERIESIYNQLVGTETPIEIIRSNLDKKGILTDWRSRIEAGFLAFIRGTLEASEQEIKQTTFEQKTRLSVELEHKVKFIESKINFVSIDDIVTGAGSPEGRAVAFGGAYYARGLKAPKYYSSDKWDGTLPFLYKKVDGREIKIVYSPNHLLSQTSFVTLRGRTKIDGIGFVANCDTGDVVITPIAFGSPILQVMGMPFP